MGSLLRLAAGIILPIIMASCSDLKKSYTSPDGYDFTSPEKFNMPSSLLEISGIAFKDYLSDTIYSVQDEEGKVFRQAWDIKKQQHTKFAPSDDFEDLAILGSQIFVLESGGTIYKFPFEERLKKQTDSLTQFDKLIPKGEYEGMYADAEQNKLYILCKSCKVDKKSKTVTGYILSYNRIDERLENTGIFKFNLEQLSAINIKLKTSFSASALSRNPRTNEWYVLSSANKLLVIADSTWNIVSAHRLNSTVFNQPEGIAFDSAYNLFISNEGDEITDGNVLKFRYVK